MAESGPLAPLTKELVERINRVRDDLDALRLDQAQYAMGKFPAALAGHPHIVALKGLMECRLGRFQPGINILAQAYNLNPASEVAALDLGEMLWHAGQRDQAYKFLDEHYGRNISQWRVLRLMCGLVRQTNNITLANELIARLALAAPDDPDSLRMIASRKLDLRKYDLAIEGFDQVLKRSPGDVGAGRAKVFAMLYQGADGRSIRRATEAFVSAAYPMDRELDKSKPSLPSGRPLRIGYVSGDFRRHVVMRFFGPLLKAHDRSRVHVTCYFSGTSPDDQTQYARTAADAFKDISRTPDATVADMVRADGIDVLIDLSGHTDDNRLGVFARRAAPVQATYLGYPATTGLRQMDYRISDAIADPVGMTESHYTEKVYRLPRCAWAYAPFSEADSALLTPAPFTRRADGAITFGSLNLLTKVNQESIRLWASILASVPGTPGGRGGARLYMTDRRGLLNDAESKVILEQEILGMGVKEQNVVLAGWVPDPAAHRRRLAEIDIMLDPLSYNGTTTTCEALLAGIPTLTVPGRAHVSRVGASLLRAVGLDQLVADGPHDFALRGIALAENPTELADLRTQLPGIFKESELGDHAGLARALEDAYYEMVRERAAKQP